MIVIKLENGLMKHWKLMKIFHVLNIFLIIIFWGRFSSFQQACFSRFLWFLYYTVIYATRNFRIIEQFSFVTFSARKWVAFPLYSEKPGGKSTKVSLLLFLPSSFCHKEQKQFLNCQYFSLQFGWKTPFAVRKTLKKNFTFQVLFLVTSALEYLKNLQRQTCQNLNLNSEIDFFKCRFPASWIIQDDLKMSSFNLFQEFLVF